MFKVVYNLSINTILYLEAKFTLSPSVQYLPGLISSDFASEILKYKSSLLKVLSVIGEGDPAGHLDLMVSES